MRRKFSIQKPKSIIRYCLEKKKYKNEANVFRVRKRVLLIAGIMFTAVR